MRNLLLSILCLASLSARARVDVRGHQLTVDGVAQPMLFGAELQYFRLRGGYGPNQPREKVLEQWNRALDKMVEAKMNAISFYIPWDFHEYAEGKFDFHGTVDQDGDGKPDYPSRDLHTFFRLIDEHGIKRIMVRPGPYINAEWGFLGFGAVPQWFHDKFPDSHMRTSWGWKTKLYDYHNPDFLEYTRRWFSTLHAQVLKDKIGPGKPILFMQVDNETNFQWQSLYSADYGAPALARYREFLHGRFGGDLAALNRAHGRTWSNWNAVAAPTRPGVNRAEDGDWYRFQDHSIATYLEKIRRLWENLGVREPEVMFTLAESYNAPKNGLLPHYTYRNAPGKTGMMTVNLYPKTFETPDRALHNQPFKADLDVLSADEANNSYLGKKEEWVLGPEIQGGWWRGIGVSDASRQQTYLTTSGHGMKALFIYYFNEGWNWGVDWAKERITPVYQQLLRERRVQSLAPHGLSNEFWGELQARCDQQVILGLPVRDILQHGALGQERQLFFDAPLDHNAQPRGHYDLLRTLGEKLFGPHGDLIARSTNLFDDVAIVKDSEMHAPGPDARVEGAEASADWAGGLLGWLLNEGVHPRVLFADLTAAADFAAPKLLVHLDTGLNAGATKLRLREAIERGQNVLNLLSSDALGELGVKLLASEEETVSKGRETLSFWVDAQGQLAERGARGARELQLKGATPLFSYRLADANCRPVLYWGSKVVGARCQRGGATVTQLGVMMFEDYNVSGYGALSDTGERRALLRALLQDAGVKPLLGVDPAAERLAAFARKDPQTGSLWITVKTSTRRAQDVRLKIAEAALAAGAYEVKDLLKGDVQTMTGAELARQGLRVQLSSEGSTVFLVSPKAK